MSITGIDSIFDLGKSVIERIWPNANKRAEEMRKLEELRQTGDLARLDAHVKLLLGQMEVNKEEAKSSSMWVAGWRPAIGWTCAVALFVAYVPKAVVITGIWSYQAFVIIHGAADIHSVSLPDFPDLGVTDLIGLLGGMLGIAGLRSFEKTKGVDTKLIQ